ncbi:MAG: HAMP domain-containing histidine kinase [Oscillospiraceae bacterium]|nr:HAMP domain-containing histidine kinase [Oscillospiraceae bacterium]
MSKFDFEKYIQASQVLHAQAGYPFALFNADGSLNWKNACSEKNAVFNVGQIDELLSDKQKMQFSNTINDKKVYICAIAKTGLAFSSAEFEPIYDGDELVFISARLLEIDDSKALVVDKESFSAMPKFLTLIREPMFNIFSIFSVLEKKLEINEMYDDYTFLKKAQKNCYKILKEATNLSEFYSSILGDTSSKSECIDLDAYAENFVRSANFIFANLPDKKIKITYDGFGGTVPVNIGEEHLTIALLNVVLNSCLAQSGIDEQIEIAVSLKTTSKTASLTVSDNGFGISKAEFSSIFTSFASDQTDRHKMGIGLNVVQAILKNNGANCIVMSDEGNGARVQLNFPILDCDKELKLKTSFSSYISDRLSLINIYFADIADTNLQ